MTMKEFAKMLSGREYGMELIKDEKRQAADAGLVVAYGYSDDNVELRGAIDEVQILGHTAQEVPGKPNDVMTDRTLSSQRATNVLIYIQKNTELDPGRLISMGLGQWRPVASNEDESTRYQNRRVEMIITGRNVEENLVGNIRQYYTETGQEDDMPSSAEMGDIPNSTEGSSS